MKVLVDTSIWSMALRRKRTADDALVKELHDLIRDFRGEIIGPIRQEILSGVKSKSQFNTLKEYLAPFEDLELLSDDYVRAAGFFNLCRSKGVQGSNTDFLICAVSERLSLSVFTHDKDFSLFSKVIPIKLHVPGKKSEK